METPGLRKERKVVTVLFADLVGFTSRAEELDPEDVEAILRPYHERLRAELERHGGTAEKVIGDAVMALFGGPIGHGGDRDRGVRAEDLHEARTPLVGRQRELGVLRDALERARQEPSSQLVTLVGVPGMGKSRLVHELFELTEADAEIVTWRQGQSLPYGEGISFWALAEMVKAQAGILETDGVTEAEAKLGAMVAEVVPEARDQEWILRHVRALAGAAGSDAS